MKCSFCGNEVEEGSKFCPVCGTRIEQENSFDGERLEYNQSNNHYDRPIHPINGTPYLIFSILTTICCCLPLGIVSIIYASKIDSLQRMGDYEGAQDAAKKAQIFMIVGAVVGVIGSVVLGVVAGMLNSFDAYDVGSAVVSEEVSDGDEDDISETDDEETDHVLSEKAETDKELGDSWKCFDVQINNTVLSFPCSFADVEAAGLTLDTGDIPEDYVINRDDYELVFFDDANHNSVMFMVCNNTEKAQAIKECTVNGINIDEYNVENGDLTIVFPGEIQIGADIGEVIEKWGKNDDLYEGDYSDIYSWYDENSYNYCSVSVDPDTKKVKAVDLVGQDLK